MWKRSGWKIGFFVCVCLWEWHKRGVDTLHPVIDATQKRITSNILTPPNFRFDNTTVRYIKKKIKRLALGFKINRFLFHRCAKCASRMKIRMQTWLVLVSSISSVCSGSGELRQQDLYTFWFNTNVPIKNFMLVNSPYFKSFFTVAVKFCVLQAERWCNSAFTYRKSC